MKRNKNMYDLPMGLSMAMAQNITAMDNFATLSPENKQMIINEARNVKSKAEMQMLADKIAHQDAQSVSNQNQFF